MPSNPQKLYSVTFTSPELKSVQEYLNPPSIARTYVNDADRFLNIVGPDGLSNRQRIEGTFTRPSEKQFIGAAAASLPIKVGTVLYLEYDKLNAEGVALDGIEVVSTDSAAFMASALAAIQADKGYVQISKPLPGQQMDGTLKDIYPNMTVWIWCRALSNKADENAELNGQFFDLTPFIQSLTTNISKNGGNFQMVLPPLLCVLDSENKFVLRQGAIDQFIDKDNPTAQRQYVAHSSLHALETDSVNKNRDPDGILARNQFLFHNIISPNDLIFIRLETLKSESKQRYDDARNFSINKNNIAGRIYDMIGLVDSKQQIINPQSNDVTINISGRDLSKLFIDDAANFFPIAFSQGLVKLSGQAEQKNSIIARNIEGTFQMLGLYLSTPISYILQFIIQGLANIKVVPNNLFTSYGDRVNKKENITSELIRINDGETVTAVKKIEQQPANGIWQIVKLVIDESVSGRRLCDSSFSMANGSLLNYLKLAVQEPLCELIMDTIGDQYFLTVRQPPYTQKALISLIEGKVNTETGEVTAPPAIIDIEAYDVVQENLMMDDSEVFSWYNFIPKNNMIGNTADFSMSYLGALFFEPYAQQFGSRQFNRTHPYLIYEPLSENNKDINLYYKQACQDLKYVVESNQATPFMRKGTIVVNGDRRLKIGNIIRYKSTGEIFFVEGVQQNFQISDNSIDRSTTISVARGMIEQLIYGVQYQNNDGISKAIGYFNIINTALNFKEKQIVSEIKTPINPKPTNIASQNSFVVTIILKPEMIKGIAYLEKYNNYPANKDIFVRFINAITTAGFNVILLPLSTNRTYIEQAALKAENPLNASAGNSAHNFGRAIDITITNTQTGKSYSKNTSEASWRETGVPGIANSLGLQWGGSTNDGTFGSYIDRCHYSLSGAATSNDVNDHPVQYTTKYVNTSSIDLDAVFSNFKVDINNFNFFLKNLQFDPNYRIVKNRQILKIEGGAQLLDEVTVRAKRKK